MLIRCLIGQTSAFGQLPSPKSPTGAKSDATGQAASSAQGQTSALELQSIESKLAEVRAKLAAVAQSGDTAFTNMPPGVSLQDLALRRALLQRLARLLEQQLASVAELESTKSRR